MSDQRADSIAYSGIPYATEQGISKAYQGKFFKEQGIGSARSVTWGRSVFVVDAKLMALGRCARRSGICTISYCILGY